MIRQRDIAGTVILYNSSRETLGNIMTYLHQVERLYVVDNSTDRNDELVEALGQYPTIRYHSFGENKGIATALNWAARQAIRDGFKVLLTMDDDTRTPETMVARMIDFWNHYPNPLGVLSGVHHNRPATTPYKPLLYTLTSGNMVNLTAYEAVGGFRDDLFIDHVDHEFDMRLNKIGYQVVELPDIHLDHKLGYSEQIKIGSWVVRKYGTNSPIRLYYYARNGVYVARTYFAEHPHFAWMVTKEMARRWIKTLLLDKNRVTRIKMLLKGMKDGWNGQLGDYTARPDGERH